MSEQTFTCNFCNKTLSSKGSLSNHINKSKRCISQRTKTKTKTKTSTFKCNFCNKIFRSKQSLKKHTVKCISMYKKKIEEQKEEYEKKLEEQKDEYEKKLKEQEEYKKKLEEEKEEQEEKYEKILKEQKEEYESKIRELQDKLENIAIKAATKPTTQHTNYIQNNLQPLTNADFTKYLDKLTPNTLINGYEGLGKYALEYPLNNRVICVDFSRKIVKFKNEAGELVNDPEMTDICERFFDSITDKSKNISNEIDNNEDDVYKAIFSKQISQIAKEIRFTGEGGDTKLKRDFVNYICKRVKN